MSARTGSVWWAELSMGAICWLVSAMFGLSYTSIGPFATTTVVYGTPIAILYVVGAVTLGAVFVSAGLRNSPLSRQQLARFSAPTVDDFSTGDK